MTTVSLCMIVRNEEKHIESCLSSAAGLADEIILVDTGSEDETLRLAERFHPKIFHCKWNDDFAAARNFSIAQAQGEWILYLDADESLYPEDIPALKRQIETSSADQICLLIHNLTQEGGGTDYAVHQGIRLFRNHRFRFEGAIHEQIVPVDPGARFTVEDSDARIRHVGYVPSLAAHKRERNIPILERILREHPEDPFHLFNLGNEYMAMNQFEKALPLYEKAAVFKDPHQAYCPHLMYRRTACLFYLRRYEDGLHAAEDGLQLYPLCADLCFLRGVMLKRLKRWTLAADSLQQCLRGDVPRALRFMSDTAYRALVELGELYRSQDDYQKAIQCFWQALHLKKEQYDLIYAVGESLNRLYSDKDQVLSCLDQMFADPSYPPNVLIMSDLLLGLGLYPQAEQCLDRILYDSEYETDKDYLFARLDFYENKYEAARKGFEHVLEPQKKFQILASAKENACVWLTACALLLHREAETIPLVGRIADPVLKQGLNAFLQPGQTPLPGETRRTVFSVLSELLKVREFDLFEQCLEILNRIESDEVLLDLAMIYYHHGFTSMALREIMHSIKECSVLSPQAAFLLCREIA